MITAIIVAAGAAASAKEQQELLRHIRTPGAVISIRHPDDLKILHGSALPVGNCACCGAPRKRCTCEYCGRTGP